ncbi:MAG: hypothetical protein ACE5SW_06860 [Nitrososphaeraceae archaeon]
MELKDFSTKTSYTNGILELKVRVNELPRQKPVDQSRITISNYFFSRI